MNELLVQSELGADTVKRFSLRKNYSFADLPEEVSESVLEKIGSEDTGGGSVFVKKAVTLNAPREEAPAHSDDSAPRHNDDNDSFEGDAENDSI